MTALEHKQIHARYGVREQVALQVEFYLCVILAVRCIVTEHEVRAVRVAVLCAAIVAHVNGWRCKDSRLRRSVDTSGLAAGAVLPLSIGGMGQNYALIAAAGGAGTVALAGLGRVRMGGQMAVAGLMGVVAWWQGVGAGAMGVMSAVPILQAGLIRRLGVTFTAAEAGLVATGLAMSGLRACGKTESVEEGLLQAGLVGVVCGVAAVVECVRSRGGKGRRIVLAGMAVMAAYVKAWGVWRTEPVVRTVLWSFSSRRRCGLVAGWFVAVLVTVLWGGGGGKRQVERKRYHLLAAAVVIAGVVTDAALTRVATAAALMCFVLLEAVGGRSVLRGEELLDDRDGGAVAVTHTYLLLGCAAPLWTEGAAGALGGVVVLCALDSAAAVVGATLGRTPLAHGRSAEGAAAAVAAGAAAARALIAAHAPRLLAAVFVTAAVETCTAQLDNLVLPLAFLSVLRAP